jgi:hypothetical protein
VCRDIGAPALYREAVTGHSPGVCRILGSATTEPRSLTDALSPTRVPLRRCRALPIFVKPAS